MSGLVMLVMSLYYMSSHLYMILMLGMRVPHTAASPFLPGRAAHTYLSGSGAGPPGVPDTAEAAKWGADSAAGAEAATGRTSPPWPGGAPPLGPAGRTLPHTPARGPETGTGFLMISDHQSMMKWPVQAHKYTYCCLTLSADCRTNACGWVYYSHPVSTSNSFLSTTNLMYIFASTYSSYMSLCYAILVLLVQLMQCHWTTKLPGGIDDGASILTV